MFQGRVCLLSVVCAVVMSALCAAETVRQDSSAGIPQKNASVSGFAAFSVDAISVEAHEYVLERCALISDLQWPLNPAVSYSVHLGIYFLNGIHFDGSFSFLQPMPAGSMTDKDFDNARLPLPRFSLTRYSEHNCVILQGLAVTASSNRFVTESGSIIYSRADTQLFLFGCSMAVV